MADNIKIVGEILNTQQISRYDSDDTNLLSPILLKEDFGYPNDYIEYFIYDAGGNLLNLNYSYKDFKLPTTQGQTPGNYSDVSVGVISNYNSQSYSTLPVIEIDPVKDLQNLGYTSGEFKVQYNFFNNRISSASQSGLFLKEISADRTELRVGSTVLTNEQIESGSLSLINEYSSSAYFTEYLLNFGNNIQAVAVNTALNKVESGYEILFKLYQPLPDNIADKVTLWVVNEKVNPYSFDINLDKLITPAPGPQLRGPNFAIETPNKNNIGTSYQNYNTILDNLNVSSSYQQLLSLITSQSIDINTDYSLFSNFTFFSSAKQRIINFYNKVKEIEDYTNNIAVYTPLTSSNPSTIYDLYLATSSINNIVANFDGFEYYLYFESGSTLTSSLEYGINPYPKSGSIKPYVVFPTGSALASLWFNQATSSADEWDDYNQNKLTYTVPAFIKDDENNGPYLTFLDMVGHYFDNIWIFLQAITDINLANNNLEKGVSKDLVYYVLQSLGTKLYNQYGDSNNNLFLVGQDSGSINFDNNFTSTGSYLNNIPRKDLLSETYKRIYHNLPLLLKTKGTSYGLQTLVSTFGITSSALVVKEYGGDLKTNTLDEFNNDKIRVVTNTITGSVLSPYISLQYQPTASNFRTNDLQYVDISFSPQDKIDIYTSASITAANPTWSIDDFIGDPRYLYSNSYATLETERNTYLSPLSASNIPFTASSASGSIGATNYNDFIRLIQFFDNSLFKMLQDFVPARTSLSTGITISSPILERNKWSYANPSSTSEIEEMDANLKGPSIKAQSGYGDMYKCMVMDRESWYTGDFSGSTIEYGDDWTERNFNPYAQYPSTSLTYNVRNIFNHSEFNVLLNNISSSRLSNTRRDIEFIYGTTGSILSPAYLQDSNESLTTYNRSRYDGVKVSSLLYNTYTSASADYGGDTSYGKTAAIDKNVRQIGLFTEIVSSSLLPGRNRISLKYLVDEFGGLTELNQRNKHWEDIQRTFIADEYLNISLFDNQKFSNQKTTDGSKFIFNSGYAYYPIMYFTGSCTATSKIFFQNQATPNSFLATANNSLIPRSISGSIVLGTPSYPVSSDGKVFKLFNNVTAGSNYLTGGTASNSASYIAQEGGDHRVNASFDLAVNFPSGSGGSTTFTLKLLKNYSTVVASQAATYDIVNNATASAGELTFYSFTIDATMVTYTEVASSKPILVGGFNRAAGYPFYKVNGYFLTGSVSPSCVLNGSDDWYSLGPWFTSVGGGIGSCSPGLNVINPNAEWYKIPDFDTPATAVTRSFSISRELSNPVNVAQGDVISLELSQSGLTTANYTASLSAGSLSISSLSTTTGYTSTTCPYFNTGSISASIASGFNNIIVLSSGLSDFHGGGYTFSPNPLSGSGNSLYPTYGDVDYEFTINPQDIIVTYLSDNTYAESTVTNVTTIYSSSIDLVQIELSNQMSELQRNNLMSSSYQSFLVLKRVEDETSAFLTFPKRDGKTSYGFAIPQNLATDVLDNIDTITKEVKQKLLADQQGTTTQ